MTRPEPTVEHSLRPSGAPPEVRWSAAEFAARFESSFRLFWLIAMSVVRDASLADDVVQEAALVALDKLGAFEPGTNFEAWMGRTVRYVALNQARREHRRRNAAPGAGNGAAPAAPLSQPSVCVPLSGELPADQQVFDDEVMNALGSISDVARACLLLRTVEGLDYREISRLLEIPEGTAMSHVHRARMYLRDRLAGRGSRPGGEADA